MARVLRENRYARPRGSPQGDELFFDSGGRMYAVSVTGLESGGEFRSGAPKPLFDGLLALAPHNFDVPTPGASSLCSLRRLELEPRRLPS